jgi:hypothetical protein
VQGKLAGTAVQSAGDRTLAERAVAPNLDQAGHSFVYFLVETVRDDVDEPAGRAAAVKKR